MSAQTLLSGGDKYYSYSGMTFGDVSVPATIPLILIPNTGLRDSFVRISAIYGEPNSVAAGSGLGVSIKLDDVEIIDSQPSTHNFVSDHGSFDIFVPRQSKLEVLSINTSSNNTQTRGVTLIGYYL